MLAAGMGKRLQKYTENQTKCMIRIAGKTLLEHACDALKSAGVHKLILVVGYHGDDLVEYARKNITDMELEFVYNTVYDTTNNIYSLYLARDYLRRDDTILLESDLIYDAEIIQELVASDRPNLATVAQYEYWMDGTVCRLDEQDNIVEFVDKKDFNYKNASQYYKTVNVYKFSKQFALERYIPFLETYIQVYGSDQYYESVLKIIAHINKMDLKAYRVGKHKWYEIDNAQDYDIAGTMFQKTEDKLASYELHFGGYWRFPKVLDYCYLVNPYFPPKRMMDQMKYLYDTLLTQYPSGMRIQRINTAKMFNVDENHILVGNGAAELINVLGRISKGKVGMPKPAFNEYVRCFENCEKVFLLSDEESLKIDVAKVMDLIDQVDMLVLVNPDNPSGSFIEKEDMYQIIEKCSVKGVTCVIDESFVDFAQSDKRYTLIEQETIDRYQNLVVVKSISKSYGIPGFRLGVMVSSNTALLQDILDHMAIWNINSFAEYFLEIMPLYAKAYEDGCDRLVQEREYLVTELEKIGYLTVYPSQANYLMCKVDGIKSRDLATQLVEKHNILIKDLSTKSGFDGKQYIRIAVRNREDNEALIAALKTFEM